MTTTSTVTLTPLQTQQIPQQAQTAAQNIANSATTAVGTNTFVFFAAFDGTDNTYVPVNGDTQNTAIAQLFDQVQATQIVGGSHQAGYYNGVGAMNPGILSEGQWYPPDVASQSLATAQAAYSDFARLAYAWQLSNPNGSITSMIAGFSRGCAAEALFAQIIYENGLVFTDSNNVSHTLIPPGAIGAISAALAIDPVLTGEEGITGGNGVNYDFPPGVENLTIVRAENEYRNAFEAANYGSDNDTVVNVPGNHSDAGDAYDSGLGGIYLGAYTSFFSNAGLDIGAALPSRLYQQGNPILLHSEVLPAITALADLQPYDISTYNSSNDITVARQEDTTVYGTPPVAAGNGTIFIGYDGNIYLSGSGYNYSASSANIVILPNSTGALTGDGDLVTIDAGASVNYEGDGFTGQFNLTQDSTLMLGKPATFAGTIFGFVPDNTNTIDVLGVGTAKSASIAGNILTVSESNGSNLNLTLDPKLNYSFFTPLVAPDGYGGTDITVADAYKVQGSSTAALGPGNFVAVNGQVIFTAYAGGKTTLGVSDGTASGTQAFANIKNAGPLGIDATDLTAIGNDVYFFGQDTSIAGLTNGSGLWETDGTASGTTEIRSGITNGSDLTDYDGQVVFEDAGYLWTTDGTAAGTQYLFNFPGSYLTSFDGQLLFRQNNQLYVTDGTKAGTQELTGIQDASPVGIQPFGFTIFNGEVLFSGVNASDIQSLWVTAGTAASTEELAGIKDAYGNSADLHPYDITIFNGKAFFAADDSYNQTNMWETDGTAAGTHELIIPNSDNQPAFGIFSGGIIPDFTVVNGKLVFYGIDAHGETGLWVSDGTAAGTDELSGTSQIFPSSNLAALGDSVLYSGGNGYLYATNIIANDAIPCFCRGTLILTAEGEKLVEELAIGDRVETLSGALKPIIWIGIGRSLVTRANKLARPVIIRRGALAKNVPHRDLYLTHGHSLYLRGVLIPVENLINHHTILWDDKSRVVEYYHIELEDHDVVLADGAPAETYYDAGNRASFQTARLGSEPGHARPTFAAVLNGGELVNEIWAELNVRAGGTIDADTTDDPDFHLLVNGERVEPATNDRTVYSFALNGPPPGVLRLCSRWGVPSLLGITPHDHRRLGVAIRQIIVHRPGIMTCFEAGASLYTEGGCHPAEDGFCWTDGELELPARLFAHMSSPFSIVVHTDRPGMRYPVEPSPDIVSADISCFLHRSRAHCTSA